jgi:hypothetical protein
MCTGDPTLPKKVRHLPARRSRRAIRFRSERVLCCQPACRFSPSLLPRARLPNAVLLFLLLAQVNSAKCLAVATLIFGIFSLLGLVFPPFFPGLGGLLAVIGCSILVCGCGDVRKPFSHVTCAVLCVIAAVLHFIALIVYVALFVGFIDNVNAQQQQQQNDFSKDSDNNDEEVPIGAYAFAAAFLTWPVLAVNLVCTILEICQAVLCMQARAALKNRLETPSVSLYSDPRSRRGACNEGAGLNYTRQITSG